MKTIGIKMALVGLLLWNLDARALEIDAEIAQKSESADEITKALLRDRGPASETSELPSLDEELVDDFKIQLVPATTDQT